jgi:hypothetical protein
MMGIQPMCGKDVNSKKFATDQTGNRLIRDESDQNRDEHSGFARIIEFRLQLAFPGK